MKRILSLFCLGLNVLLLFIAFFNDKVSIPSWMSFVGRTHPMVLHIPIGLAIGLLFFYFLKSKIEKTSFDLILENLLLILSFFAVLSAFAGLVLSFENGYEAATLQNHKYTGVILSILLYALYEFRNFFFSNPLKSKISIFASIGLMLAVGHLGGNITHGEDFLFGPKKEVEANTVFEKFVNSILDKKCKSCHNSQKAKGKLDMSTIEKIKIGGKNGKLWVGGDTLNSHLLKRAYLDLEDKKHMPPKGKPQLTEIELNVLKNWIKEGANYETKLSDIKPNSFFYTLKGETKSENVKVYNFSAVSEGQLEKYNSPFCTIAPIASGSPALKVNFFVSSKFDPKTLQDLSNLSEQIVSLNLSKMPVDDGVFSEIAKFKNLEYLNLNQTNITGKGIEQLKSCKNLEGLALANTKLNFGELKKVLSMPSLKKVFLWETHFNPAQQAELKKSKMDIEFGYVPDESEILKLNAPILVNESSVLDKNAKVQFKHSLQNVEIRYTLDGSVPDSSKSLIYKEPLSIKNYGQVSVLATKEGWLASNVKNYYFFKSDIKAKTAQLNLPADPKYVGNGNETLIDGKQGDPINFKDKNWLGFRENNFEGEFVFEKPTKINGLTLSYAEKTDAYIMPPVSVDIWVKIGGKPFEHFKKIDVPQLTKLTISGTKGLDVKIDKENIEALKIVASPLKKLPNWHPGKGDKGWLFVDEVFFY
ncbi:peptidylprolyl isomerase [Lacihabitans sp. LS3-19]|uniref:chitobiase/beta-hexosaminidase C-terminal domain-containing protein n=1 Tax=Lacihabitans sp. LS3-19 TaxID=2487335 RepID=UPI0020CFA62D|nr:chitobiase/beta-hexosaminidase C-terminal domain-containing protein [Lacihabitans sp. LS3-19]MCP9768015.1 peptidylprolyl isomerase [Lacihabitans sp. LS3-19]